MIRTAYLPTTHFSGLSGGATTGGLTGKSRLLYLAPNAVSSFWNDTAGVYLPKVPTWRSHIQAFKDTFLEFVEDGAFYFTIPIVGPILARSYQGFVGLSDTVAQHALEPVVRTNAKEQTIQWLGTPFHLVEKQVEKVIAAPARKELLNKIAATKAGALVGAVAIASGFEYLIPHLNNLATKELFNTVNFTAVAGLEKQRDSIDEGEVDIIKRAKKRFFQVSAIAGGLLLGSAALPTLLKGGAKNLKQLLRFVDFDARPEMNAFFDLSTPLLAVVIGHGVASYLDASQSSLERKETGLRLAFVVPYLLAGGQLTKNLLGWIGQNRLVDHEGGKFILGDGKAPAFIKQIFGHRKAEGALGLNFLNEKRQWSDAFTKKGQFLNFDFLKSKEVLREALEAAEISGKKLSKQTIFNISDRFANIGPYAFWVKTLGMGVSVNLLAYALTRHRHQAEQSKEKKAQQEPTKVVNPSSNKALETASFNSSGPLYSNSAEATLSFLNKRLLTTPAIKQQTFPQSIGQGYSANGFPSVNSLYPVSTVQYTSF